jgi:hypothetical protein
MHGDAVETTDVGARPGWGPTLIGGIVGAAVGIGLHIVLETGVLGTPPYEAAWFAIAIGLLTGLGVRWANKNHMERSYARGAASAFIALGAIVLSTFLISKVMASRDAMAKKPITGATMPADAETDAEAGDAVGANADAADAAPAADAPADRGAAPVGQTDRAGRPRGPDDLNPWQFVFMALGGLVAYEFGRGIDHSKRAVPADERSEESLVGGTDPSN